MPPTPDVLRRAAATLRSAADALGTAEARVARVFAASGWRGPAARRCEAALQEQGRGVAGARRALQSLADELDHDARELRRTLLVATVTASTGGQA